MHFYLFDHANLRAVNGFVAVPGPVQKIGPVADTVEQSGDWALDAFSGSVLPRQGGGWRAYVTAFHRGDIHRSRPFVVESNDGLAWRRVDHVRFENLPDGFAGFIKQPSVVLIDGGYRMYVWFHGEWQGRSVGRLCTAHSRDGLTFTVERFDPPVLHHINELKKWGFEPGLTPTEAFDKKQQQGGDDSPELLALKRLRSNDSINIVRDPETGQFILYGVLFVQNPVGSPRREDRDNARSLLRVITRRSSDDGYAWSDPEIVLTPDDADPLDQQFYYLSPHRQDGYWFGLLGDYEVIEQTMDLGLAVSRDGRSWSRPMRSPLIVRDPNGYDSQSIQIADGLVDLGDDWGILHRGGPLKHNVGSKSHQTLSMAVGRIGKRRWIGQGTATNRDARLVTSPIFLTKPQITLDADIRGRLRVELCDAFGHPVAGYRREDFLPITGDSRRHVLAWKDRTTVPFQYEPVSLRFEATDATLYAVEC